MKPCAGSPNAPKHGVNQAVVLMVQPFQTSENSQTPGRTEGRKYTKV